MAAARARDPGVVVVEAGGHQFRRLGNVAIAYIVLIAVARILGFGRESVIAYLFGETRRTDAYIAATAVPELFAGILLSGVIGFMLIPGYARFESAGRPELSRELLGSVLGQSILWSSALALLATGFAPTLMHVAAPGLAHAARHDAILMLRITSPSIVFFAIAGVAGGVLNTQNRFFPIPMSLIVANASALLVLVMFRHVGILAASFAYVTAAAVTAGLQFALLRRAGFTITLVLRPPSPAVRTALLSGGTAVLAISTAFARPFVERALASTLNPGDIAAVGFASKVFLFAGALIAVSIGTLSFPGLAAHAATGRREEFRRVLRRGLSVVLLFAVPASLLLGLLAHPIVRIVFEHGRFGANGTRVTGSVLALYAICLVPICANELLVRALLALRQERAVLATWSAALAVTFIVDVVLVGRLGVRALPIGAAAGLWVNLIAMTYRLRTIDQRSNESIHRTDPSFPMLPR